MIKFLSLILCLKLAALCPDAKDKNWNNPSTGMFYFKIVNQDSLNANLKYGSIEVDKSVKGIEFELSEEEALDSIVRKFNSLPAHRQNVLYYVHGMWGDRNNYFKLSNGKLYEHIYKKDDNKYGLIINLLWPSGYDYHKNTQDAINMGEIFLDAITKLNQRIIKQNIQFKQSLLTHSMGARIFQGMFKSHKQIKAEIQFENAVLVSADLEPDIFYEDQPLYGSEKFARNIAVYFHEYDRTLMMSQLINQKSRIGLHGISNMDSTSTEVILLDASYLDDSENIVGRGSNHRYLFGSPAIRNDIFNILNPDALIEEVIRKKRDHERSLAITTKEDMEKLKSEQGQSGN